METGQSDNHYRFRRSVLRTKLKELETFCTLARTLNFSRAAEQLHYAQSSVTEHIQNLEADFDITLFDRGGRSLELTAAGEQLLDYADRILSLVQEAHATLRRDGGGGESLTIVAPETFCARRLPAVLARFRSMHSEVSLAVRPASRGELLRAVADGDADMSLVLGNVPTGPAWLRCEMLGTESLCLIAHPQHRLNGLPRVAAGDLMGEAFLSTAVGCVYREIYDGAIRTIVGAAAPVVELASLAAIVRCVATGMGIALLPKVAAEAALADGSVVALPWDNSYCTVPVWLSWDERNSAPWRQRFIELMREVFRHSSHATRNSGSITALVDDLQRHY
ncbi:MAG: LysR family transcriptional regulator [Gammaproteobacteria bacterium]|nr:LysR family transcriptional regulator [Gammaproteobacteria bacterium]